MKSQVDLPNDTLRARLTTEGLIAENALSPDYPWWSRRLASLADQYRSGYAYIDSHVQPRFLDVRLTVGANQGKWRSAVFETDSVNAHISLRTRDMEPPTDWLLAIASPDRLRLSTWTIANVSLANGRPPASSSTWTAQSYAPGTRKLRA